jgi:hypothetical protein
VTIRRGEPWGVAGPRPPSGPRASSDAELAGLVERGVDAPVQLVGGDLQHALGGPSAGPTVQLVPVDVLRVEADGVTSIAAAHVVACWPGSMRWWRGPIIAVMNVGSLGNWDVAPRAHPNDGRADVLVVDRTMSLRARWAASRRLPTGTHVPHPSIRVTQPAVAEFAFDEPMELRIDGRRRGRATSLRVTVVPDACTVYV